MGWLLAWVQSDAVPETPITFEDVEVIEADGLGLTCRIGTARTFIGKYVPLEGTTLHGAGDRGRLILPRWFVEQQGLPLAHCMAESDVDTWLAAARLRVAAAQEVAGRAPSDAAAQATLHRAAAELAAAMTRAMGDSQSRR